MALNFINTSGFYGVTFATSVFISYYILLKLLYYSFNFSAAVICVYLSFCCINKLLLQCTRDERTVTSNRDRSSSEYGRLKAHHFSLTHCDM